MRLVDYRHPEAGFSLPLPDGWERAEDTPGVALVAVEPERDGRFRSNVVVTIEQLPPGTTLQAWEEGGDALLPRMLDRYLRLDDDRVGLGEHQARRTLAHHTTAEGHAVTMQQWTLVAGACGYTLTASTRTLDFDQVADLFTALAEGFRPNPEYSP